jgi:hypothetical protein
MIFGGQRFKMISVDYTNTDQLIRLEPMNLF